MDLSGGEKNCTLKQVAEARQSETDLKLPGYSMNTIPEALPYNVLRICEVSP